MGVLCMLGFHTWEYITTSVLRFRGCQRCGKWQRRTESDRKWKTPGMTIEWGYTTWDEMKARIYEEAEDKGLFPEVAEAGHYPERDKEAMN